MVGGRLRIEAHADELAFHRDVLDFKNCLLVEQPNGDFAQTIARQLLFSTWQHMLLQRLTQSSDRFLSEFAPLAEAVEQMARGDLELHPLQDELPKLPVAPPPDMGK